VESVAPAEAYSPVKEAAARALALDPLSLPAHNSLGSVLIQMGRDAEAATALTAALELEPDYADAHGWLGLAYLRVGRRDEGLTELEAAARLSHNQVRMVARLAHAYGLAGRHADGQRLVQTLVDRSGSEYVSPIWLAHAYAGLGQSDRAFAYLEDAYRQRTPILMRLKSGPMLDPLKADPRFADLTRRLNLPWP
jgi:tetratricopeptide (TPR) repeat protein